MALWITTALGVLRGIPRRWIAYGSAAVLVVLVVLRIWWLLADALADAYDKGRADALAEVEEQRERAAEAAQETRREADNLDDDGLRDALTGGVQ